MSSQEQRLEINCQCQQVIALPKVKGARLGQPSHCCGLTASTGDSKKLRRRTTPLIVTMATTDSASVSAGSDQQAWTQLSGHADNFRPGSRPGRVMKRLCQSEAECLRALASEPVLKEFAPAYYATHIGSDNGGAEQFLEMQDLLFGFSNPISLMDCKMGCRTYLEDELALARRDANPRPDMYRRMLEADPDAPTAEQRAAGAVTKLDYMLWRERLSSTSSLAFRIDGLRRGIDVASSSDSSSQPPFDDFKRLRCREDVLLMLKYFVGSSGAVAKVYLERMRRLRDALTQSEFFPNHELIGSSLLFVHDQTGQASVWMIDFGKTRPSPRPLTHATEWIEGNHEDGYMIGLDNLIGLFQQLVDAC